MAKKAMRFLSARWKTFWDRGFFNNHIPILVGKQLGYLISVPCGNFPICMRFWKRLASCIGPILWGL